MVMMVPASSAIRVAVPNPIAIPMPMSSAGEGQSAGTEKYHVQTRILPSAIAYIA